MKQKAGFSKVLLIQESILMWIISIAFLVLAFLCVFTVFDPQLAWFTVLPGLAWGAYGVSQAFYYKKAQAENTEGGLVYDATMAEFESNGRDEE